jgi:hypothetical protein
MPTTRPRHTLTETDQLAAALEEAAKRWPEETSPRRLLVRLVEEGYRALRDERSMLVARRRNAIRRTSGAFTDVYPDDYLAQLRDEWPE